MIAGRLRLVKGDRSMRRSTRWNVPEIAADKKIRDLENELWKARRTIIDLGLELAREFEEHPLPAEAEKPSGEIVTFPGAPDPQPATQTEPLPLERLFRDYHGIGSDHEYYAWRRTIIDRVAKIAERRATPGDLYSGSPSPRAACPLCRDIPTGWGYPPAGYALPEGLERHLTGWGNMSKCSVMEALDTEAAGATKEARQEAERAKAAQQEARRRNETVYLIEPFAEPVLLEENRYWGKSRNPEELAAAEERLRELGFARETDGNIVVYRLRRAPYAVLADPRTQGRISFHVYDERRKVRQWGRTDFYMLDSWHNDIVGKFETRFKDTIAWIEKPKR